MQSKPSWQVRRTGSPQRDGRGRWDEAYQLLLHWRWRPRKTTRPPWPIL